MILSSNLLKRLYKHGLLFVIKQYLLLFTYSQTLLTYLFDLQNCEMEGEMGKDELDPVPVELELGLRLVDERIVL